VVSPVDVRLISSVTSYTHAEAKLNRTPVAAPTTTAPAGRLTATLLNGLSQDDAAHILAAAVGRKFSKGRTIIRTDEPATQLFLIKTGSVNYYRVGPDGRQVLLIRLFAGDTFGLGTLVEKPVSYIGTAEALSETDLYSWGQTWIRQYVKQHPTLALNALRIAMEYIRLYSDRHLALVSGSVEDRLTLALTQLGLRAGHPHPRGLEIEITNEHLASLADIGYFTASRLLNKWQKRGAVEKSRGKVIIHCPEKMLS
jgi:CRP-like cAMP-binding protein